MADSQRKMVVWILAGAAGAMAAGALIAWVVRGGEVRSLGERVAELETAAEDAKQAASDVQDEPSAATDAASLEGGPSATSASDAGAQPAGPTERQPGIVHSLVDESGTWRLTIDYVRFLTGTEAATEAAAHGDESPPPNDYYVVNDNPKLREFPVQAGIGVVVVTNDDGTSDPDGHSIALSQWAAALKGPHADAFASALYWVTVTEGTITAIEAQYVP